MESFLGTIQAFGFNFAPVGWASCNGGLLSISQNTALFSLLGTNFGGDGASTFGLPNLQGKTMIGFGASIALGQSGGAPTATLTQNNLPAHTHALMASTSGGNQASPADNMLAASSGSDNDTQATVTVFVYAPAGTTSAMAAGSIASTGGSQPFSIQAPYQAVNMCIAIQGLFPSRP